MYAEGLASGKAGEIGEYAYNVECALGTPPERPIVLLTDNLSNAHVASATAPGKARHHLRRYFALMQRVEDGYLEVRHVKDKENAADFLTKRVGKDKLTASLKWATGE